MDIISVDEEVFTTMFEEEEKYWDSKETTNLLTRFIKRFEKELSVEINRYTGTIKGVDSEYPVHPYFKLNNDVLRVYRLYFDDRQLLLRLDDMKLRRVRLDTIEYIDCNERRMVVNVQEH